jgi:hypothetical protein
MAADISSSAISLALVGGPDSLWHMQKVCEINFKSTFLKGGGISAWSAAPWN